MTLQGHLKNNGGIRASSAGPLFPFIVFAKGINPTTWHILQPSGIECPYGYESSTAAHRAAKYLKTAWLRN